MTEYITISSPNEYGFHKKLKAESARTGKPISLILREAFERYSSSTGNMDDFISQEHRPLLDMSVSRERADAVVENILKKTSPDRAYEIGSDLVDIGCDLRDAATKRMGGMVRAGGGMGRSPGVT